MEFPQIDNTAEYVEFMQKNFPNKKIGKMPKSAKDIELAVRMEMENTAPHLLQRIINPKPEDTLPADVLNRYRQNQLWVDDIPIYRQAGFSGLAANMQRDVEAAEKMILDKKIAESKAKNDAVANFHANRPKGMQHMPPLSQEQIMAARERWGITNQPTWDKGQD